MEHPTTKIIIIIWIFLSVVVCMVDLVAKMKFDVALRAQWR